MASIIAPTANNGSVPALEPSEVVRTVVNSGAELTLTIPDIPPSASATSGGSGGSRKRKETGGIWLTNQRFIFVFTQSHETLSAPLHAILSTKFEQPPFFGTNFLAFDLLPAGGGGLTNGTRAELRFKDLPMFDFVNKLEGARMVAIQMRRQAREEEETLPVYTSGSATPFGVPTDDPPSYDA